MVNEQESNGSSQAGSVAVIVDVQYVLTVHDSKYPSTTVDWKRLVEVLTAGRESVKPVAIDGFSHSALHMELRRSGFRLEVLRPGFNGVPGAKSLPEVIDSGCTDVELVSGDAAYNELASMILDAGLNLVTTSHSHFRDKALAEASASVRDLESLPIVRMAPVIVEGSQ